MTTIYRWKGPRLLNRYCTTVCCKKWCRSSNRLIYDKSAPQNIYTITGALIFDTKFYSFPFFPITCFSNHHILYIIWKLIISKFILLKPFWNRTLRYHRNGTLKSFSGLLPFSGRCHIPNVLRLIESQLFIILTKYISLERSESQDSIFVFICDKSNGRERYICDRKVHKKNSTGFEWHPVAVCGITPKQIA